MCYMHMHRCVCMTTMHVLYTCMSVEGSMCIFISTQCLCLGSVYMYMLPIRAMFVLWGSVCMLCNGHVCLCKQLLLYICDYGGQCVILCVECLHICMWGVVSVLCACTHMLCVGSEYVACS